MLNDMDRTKVRPEKVVRNYYECVCMCVYFTKFSFGTESSYRYCRLQRGETALHTAALWGHPEIVKRLIEIGGRNLIFARNNVAFPAPAIHVTNDRLQRKNMHGLDAIRTHAILCSCQTFRLTI